MTLMTAASQLPTSLQMKCENKIAGPCRIMVKKVRFIVAKVCFELPAALLDIERSGTDYANTLARQNCYEPEHTKKCQS